MKRGTIAGWVLGLVVVCMACPVTEVWAQDASEEDAGADGEAKPPPPEDKPSTLRVVAGYSLSIAGTFVIAALVVYTLSRTLKYEGARNALVHLLRTAPNHAQQQCWTMPNSFYEAIGLALKTGGMLGGTRDPAIIASATAPAYDAAASQVTQHWKGLLGKGKMAGLAAVGAIALKPGVFTIILGVVAAGGLVWLWFYKSEIDRSLFRAKVEVLPEVDRAFIDGRYYIPPAA